MEFSEVVRHRRMVRRYDMSRPVDPTVVDAIVSSMLRAPSAGFSQGSAFLILDTPEDVARFRAAATPVEDPDNWFACQVDAPVIIIALSNKDAYLDRYAQADKGFSDRSEGWWTAPYWDIDAGMASMIGLLATVDHGLSACFFGVEINTVAAIRAAFGIPAAYHPIGAISIGYGDEPPRDLRSRRKQRDTLVHRHRWD